MIDYSKLPNSIITPDGKYAWVASDLPFLMDYIIENKWIILGGDVLTYSGNYTYDNWYYNPKHSLSVTQNMHQSIAVCLNYVTNYTNRNGSNFLFLPVISNSYCSG